MQDGHRGQQSYILDGASGRNHATTVFYGDTLWDTAASTNGSVTNWQVFGSNTLATDSGAVRGTFVDNVSGVYIMLRDAKDLSADLVIGRTYQIQYDIKVNTGSVTPKIARSGGGVVYSGDAVTSTTFVTKTIDFVCDHATDHYLYTDQMHTGEIVYLDNFSLKEVGVATGWTDADQQLDIAQPALQSYNELAWFDGTADYCEIADHNDFSFVDGSNEDEPFSVSAWIFMNDATTFPIISKNEASKREWTFYVDSADKLHLKLYDDSASEATEYGHYNTAITSYEGQWIHVVGTYDGSGGTSAGDGIQLYINGVAVATTTGGSGTYVDMENLGGKVMIGADKSAGFGYANGCITEVAIFGNRAIGAANVLELYNEGKAGDAMTITDASYIVGYWRNNGLSTWTDLSTNSHNGTPTSVTETLLIPQGVDGSRDAQGFLMNKKRSTSLLNTDGVVYGQISDSDSFDFGTTAFTIQAWVKPRSLAADDRIITKGTTGNGDFMISVGGDNTSLRVYAKDSGAAAIDSANEFSNLTLDTWQFITVVVDTPNDRILFYKDDGSVETKSGTFGGNFNNDNPVTIATNSSLATNRFNGQIDGLLIYNKALDATEKTRNYKATKGSHRN
tara:strand:- start:131 stop:1990 length:1860 start_codon:yes stop_codon:yes gene_type:complete